MPRRCMDYMKNEVKTFPQSTAIGERERERERTRKGQCKKGGKFLREKKKEFSNLV
jgi:hypothetical protein